MSQFYFFPVGNAAGSNASVGPNGQPIPASSTEVGGENPSGNLEPLQVDSSGNLFVNIAASVLPAGSATAANQVLEITQLTNIDNKLPSALGSQLIAGSLAVNIASDQIVPVSASALPLPTGASTSALQISGNSSLSSIDGKLNSLGQKAMAGSVPVVIASDQSPIPISGTISGTVTANQGTANTIGNAWPVLPTDGTHSQSFTVGGEAKVDITQPLPAGSNNIGSITNVTGTISLPTNAAQETGGHLASLDSKFNSLGQKTMANSAPVVIASDQSAIPVSASSLPLPTGAATAANQATEIADLNALNARLAGSLTPVAFDEVDLTYVTSGNGIGQVSVALFKLLTVLQATLTFTYNSSNQLTSVVKT